MGLFLIVPYYTKKTEIITLYSFLDLYYVAFNTEAFAFILKKLPKASMTHNKESLQSVNHWSSVWGSFPHLCEGGGQQRSVIPKQSQRTFSEWGTTLGSSLFISLAPMTTCGPTRPEFSLIWMWTPTAKKRWGKVSMPPTRKVSSVLKWTL